MYFFRLLFNIVLFSFLIFIFTPSNVQAAQVWRDGDSGPTEEANCPNDGSSFACNAGGSLSCIGSITVYDLGLCQLGGASYNNSCNTSNWTLTYAKSCTVTGSVLPGQDCNYAVNYDTHTCSVADSCRGQPYLYPGVCDASRYSPGGNPDDACVSSPTAYKTCCTNDGNVNGACTGGLHSGSCPGGSTTIMCGVSQGTCNAVYPYPCTTASCGGDACSILRPDPPDPPDPSPPPPTGSCQCRYPENCITPDNRAGVRECYGVNVQSSGSNVCRWDDSGACSPDCTGCRAQGQSTPGGQTGSGRSGGGGGDMNIYIDPSTSLQGKNLIVTVTMRGYCKSNLRLYADTKNDNGDGGSGNFKRVGGFNVQNCRVKVAPHDNDAGGNPKDRREGWGQWECAAENVGGWIPKPGNDPPQIPKWTAGAETHDPNGGDDDECFAEREYFVNPSARIIGRFFYDSNGDGIRQSGEPLIKQSDNLCRDLNGNGVCDSTEPRNSCAGGVIRGNEAWVEVSGQSNQYLGFCDAGGPYFDFGILPTGNYTIRFRNQGWAFTTQADFTENISGRREFLFGSRYPPCSNTTPGTNQLTGCLWDGINFNLPDGNTPTGPSVSSDNATALNQDWGNTPNIPNSFVGDNTFSAIWKGNFNFKTNGTYTFYAGADDGVKLKIDGNTIIDSWIDTGYFERVSTPYTFVSSGSHLVELEYYENGGAARASLRWTFAPASNAWIQTIGGDVHSNVSIDMGGEP